MHIETKAGIETVIQAQEEILRAKAGELKVLAETGLKASENLRRLSLGFQDLSHLAKDCRRQSVSKNSRRLSTIFDRTIQSIPEDVPFILNAAVNFLDSVLKTSVAGMDRVGA